MKKQPQPKGVIHLQWHITNRCNFRCKHCYHTAYSGDELDLVEMKKVFHQFLDLADSLNKEMSFAITGGEPFLRKQELFALLAYIAKFKNKIRFVLLMTNGSLVTSSDLEKLKKIKLRILFQVSIEGSKKINDSIRGKGSFEKIFRSIHLIKSHGFIARLAATLSKANHEDIFNLLDLLILYDIRLGLHRLVPMGNSSDKKNMLTPRELENFYQKIYDTNREYARLSNGRKFTSGLIKVVNCKHALRYAKWPDSVTNPCFVRNKRGIVVMPNGDTYPCRILPIKIGNVKETTLKEIYNGSYNQFTQKEKQDKRCQKCDAYPLCEGGAACIAYAVTGNFYARDPQCFYQSSK